MLSAEVKHPRLATKDKRQMTSQAAGSSFPWMITNDHYPVSDSTRETLLGSGCLHEQLYRRRYHKEQYCLWLSGGFQKFDISLPLIWADQTIFVEIIQGLQADLGNPGQVTRHRGQLL